MDPIHVKQKEFRNESCRLKVVIVGAGLGGLGTAISCILAGHEVTILETAPEISEVGAGIQILPNGSRVLHHWGLSDVLDGHATRPKFCNFRRWQNGELLASMDFQESQSPYGARYGDFHRASLQKCLLERVAELGGEIRCNSRVTDIVATDDGATATASLAGGEQVKADLLVGSDGVFSKLVEVLLGRPEPPLKTGDLAYRLLLSTEEMLKDPELAEYATDPQVNYWLGPDAHAVNYVLRGGELFNMVLCVPDDIPDDGAATAEGNVDEMCAAFEGWDPKIQKLLKLCKSVHKWRLCYRMGDHGWTHPSGTWTMLGDAVHAMLPYLASGASMVFEDAAVLGECLSRLPKTESKDSANFIAQKRHALAVYETCRKQRTKMVVERSNLQQHLEHLHDGPEQEERDRQLRMVPPPEGEPLPWRDSRLAPKLFGYNHIEDVSNSWARLARKSSAL